MLRIRDSRECIYSFQDEFLVKCPRCNGRAKVRRVDPDDTDLFAPRRFSCKSCGASKDWAKRAIGRRWYDEAVDDYFHYHLWLQAPCCGHTLWAYNLRHLDFIEAYADRETSRKKTGRSLWLVESEPVFSATKMDAISKESKRNSQGDRKDTRIAVGRRLSLRNSVISI